MAESSGGSSFTQPSYKSLRPGPTIQRPPFKMEVPPPMNSHMLEMVTGWEEGGLKGSLSRVFLAPFPLPQWLESNHPFSEHVELGYKDLGGDS